MEQMKMIYDSVFDVIRIIDPNSEYLRAYEYHKKTGLYSVKVPNKTFYWVELPNEKGLLLSPDYMSYQYFRGENSMYPTCESSRSRNCKSSDDKIIADLKVIEFELALKQFPRVYLAEENDMFIDYVALAQHYGFDTNYLDLTNDIGVAAFFACSKINNDGTFSINDNGYAQIRVTTLVTPDNPLAPENKLHIFGVQPFERPSRQNGSCLQLDDGEDFAKRSSTTTYVFKTNSEDSLVIINCFLELLEKQATNHSYLFPNEIILPVADEIRKRKCISNKAIEVYCSRFNVDRASIVTLLDNNCYSIIYAPIKWISDEDRSRLEIELTPYPYGKNNIGVRLCYKPI